VASSVRPTAFDELADFLSVEEAATYMNVCSWTVYEAVKRGEIPHRKFGRKKIRIPKSYFDPRIAENAAQAQPAPAVRQKRASKNKREEEKHAELARNLAREIIALALEARRRQALIAQQSNTAAEALAEAAE
jgi:excisionase family DNA binding protein